jgi:class 3 adenylate cyclase
MQPQIRYAKSADGTNISYWAIGDGRPLVYMPPMPWCHIEREWAIPEWRRRYERLATGRRLVRYDARGFGLSDPSPADVTPAAHAADLEAVLDALAIDQCDLFAPGDSGFAAIEFCARAGKRVGQLVLWGSYANRDRLLSDPKVTSLRALWDEDWFQYTELAIRTIFGWKHGDRAEQLAEFYRAAATQESIPNVIGALYDIDLTPLLPSVDVPTLVVALGDSWVDVQEEARNLAAALPNAQLRTVHGETIYFDFFDDEDAVVTLVNEFLGGGVPDQRAAAVHPAPTTGGLCTVLFTDLVGHTEMMQRLGDTGGRDVLREHERITRTMLNEFGGTEVKTMGDGFMASFGSVTKAMDCAIALQQAFEKHSESMPEPLHVRVGLNAGEPIEEDGDLFGSMVIMASRITARAGAGEILIPEPLRHLLSGKNYVYTDRGETMLKGFEDAVRLYEVRWQEDD